MIDFSKKYNSEKFTEFLSELLPDDIHYINKDLKIDKSFNLFEKATLIAEVNSLNNLKIIEIQHTSSEKSRITISKDLFKLLSYFSYTNILVITYCKFEDDYRFSLITSKINWISDQKVKKEFSNPKRLSFLLGPNSKIHTPTKQLIKRGKIIDFEDLKERFNIEVVNNEFFDHYKNLFLYLKRYLDEDKKFSQFSKKIKLETSFFAKKLLGQIIFCYFLQKKGWIGIDENKNFGSGDQNFLRNQFIKYNHNKKNFFNDFLEFFFYEGLNNQNENDFVKSINTKVPYLGGGLFEYYDGYDWKKETLNIPNKTFSNKDKTGILDIFDLYNFTVDESVNSDIEISIDPEMLGRVFENLLEENIRKEGGAFYTPRIIVNFMSQESILSYLKNKFTKKIDFDNLVYFVKNENRDLSEKKDLIINADLIDNYLADIKICDPAIGSGAFAVSMMNLVVLLRLKLKIYVKRKYKNTSYHFKRHFILNNIYGVDIDESAVEITKLRLWLSLIVDEIDFNNTEPLPNLEFKIIQGNSLIETFQGINLGSKIFESNQEQNLETLISNDQLEIKIKELAELQGKFINTISYVKKQNIKKNIENSMIDIFNLLFNSNVKEKSDSHISAEKLTEMISPSYKRNFFPWGIFFADVFYYNNGFDIVIANPPYISTKEISKFKWKRDLENNFGFVDDLYNHFSFLATYITKNKGIISFITSDTFMTLQTKKNMRDLLLKYNLKKLVTTPKAFKAMVDTCIFFLEKEILEDNDKIEFIDLKNIKISSSNNSKKFINWEKALAPIFLNEVYLNGKNISHLEYKNNLNSVFFSPTPNNLNFKKNIIPILKINYEKYWELIKTSKKISQNRKIIEYSNKEIKEKDCVMLGLITNGGVGLQTGDNGSFVACVEGTKESNRIIQQRPIKLFNFLKNNKNLPNELKKLKDINNLNNLKEFLTDLKEIDVQKYFIFIKKKYGRDIFGQGFLFSIITNDQIIDLKDLTDDIKMNGIENKSDKIYVPYDKGDKEGNKWYLKTPYYIKWNKNSVLHYKTNELARWQGYDFFFKKGFCWSDVHTDNLKCRLKDESVNDVKSMSLSTTNNLVSNKYLVCVINSELISEFQQNFLNNTSSFQINDARKLPIIIPRKEEIKEFEFLFDEAMKIKMSYFKNTLSEEQHLKALERIQKTLNSKVEKIYNF